MLLFCFVFVIEAVPRVPVLVPVALAESSKASQKQFLLKRKKILLKIRLSLRVRNFAALNEPLNICLKINFNPKVAPHRDFIV
jgi:hypothetical protein